MGNLIGSYASSSSSSVGSVGRRRERKRGREEVRGEGDPEEVEELSPRRKRIQTTSSYIYDRLFLNGVKSDVTIVALGKEWKLHKLYLCQSGYFSGMFSGNWRESEEDSVTLDIPDPNITTLDDCGASQTTVISSLLVIAAPSRKQRAALDLAFSSLYRDEVHLAEDDITATVAAASMLQMDGLLEHCTVFMRETMRQETVLHYLSTSSLYGLTDLEAECNEWLKVNLIKNHNISLLRQLSAEKLEELISSHDLFVLQVEMDVYTMAKRWLFLTLHPLWSGTTENATEAAEEFFRAQDECFLEVEEGGEYVEVFRALRLQHIMNDVASVSVLETDKIIPHAWLLPIYRRQWHKMCMVEQRLEPGPFKLNEDQFNEHSFRCGRVLHEAIEYCWRWTGYFFGIDVIITYYPNTGNLSVKRNTKSLSCDASVSLQHKRQLVLRLRAVSLGTHNEVTFREDTGTLRLSLAQDQEYSLLKLGNNFTFPLYISVNMALTSIEEYSLTRTTNST